TKPKAEPAGKSAAPAAVPRSGWGALTYHFPQFPAGEPFQPIGDELVANGLPMNLAWFHTDRPGPEVLEFYGRYFYSKGWSLTGLDDALKVVPFPSISATDPTGELQATVMDMGPARGRTMIVLGLADMTREGPTESPDIGDLPSYPGTQPIPFRSLDPELATLTVTFSTPDDAGKVAGFYRAELARLGYVEREEPNSPESKARFLRFSSPRGDWTVTITPESQGKGGATAVTAIKSSPRVAR
ncbi:MAG TPA: hypothetical protein DFS52_29730, partial [Myxococcales bacterium]|nr:hypothetical protein [Myxococcales bacterium]